MMLKLIKFFSVLAALILQFAICNLQCADIYPNAGTTSAAFLKLGLGSRAVGMGEAFGAIADDVSALYWNPAGLAQMKRNEFHLTHNQSFESINLDFMAYAKVTPKYTIAAAIYGVTMPSDLERRSGINEADPFEPFTSSEGQFGAHDVAVHFAYGRALNRNLSVGTGVKVIQQTIDNLSAYGIAADGGLLYKMDSLPMSIGLVVQNVGTPIKFVDTGYYPPFNVKLAGAYFINKHATLALDLNKPIDNYLFVSAGGEFKPVSFIAVRLGYKYLTEGDQVNALSGASAGVGINFSVLGYDLRADYAFSPYGVLGNSQRFSITSFFGNSVAKPYDSLSDRENKIEPDASYNTKKTSRGQAAAVQKLEPEHIDKYYETKVTAKPMSKSSRGVVFSIDIECPECDLYSINCLAKSLPNRDLTVKIAEKNGSGKVYKRFSFDKNIPIRLGSPECRIMIPERVKNPVIKTESGKLIALSKITEANDYVDYRFKMDYLETFTLKSRETSDMETGDGTSPSNYIRQGIDAFRLGDYNTAVTRFELALKLDPKNEKASAFVRQSKEKLGRKNGISIAVPDFVPTNISASNAASISDQVRNKLSKTGAFNVIDRSIMDAIFSEQKVRAQSCGDAECAVRIGKLLNSRKVVVGTLSKMLEGQHLTISVIDVETGKTEFSQSMDAGTYSQIASACDKICSALASYYKNK